MSWQEELRQLDLQHSRGLLTEEQYRAKREDVLAEASCAPSVRPFRNIPADTPPTQRQRPSAADLLATRLPTTAPSPADERPTERIAPPPRPARRATRPVTTPIPPPPPVPAAPEFPPPGRPHRIGAPKRTQPPWLVVMLGVFVVLAVIIGAMWWIGTLYHGQPSAPATVTGGIPQPADRSLIDRLPALPGQPHPRSSTVSADKGAELELPRRPSGRQNPGGQPLKMSSAVTVSSPSASVTSVRAQST